MVEPVSRVEDMQGEDIKSFLRIFRADKGISIARVSMLL